MAFQTPITVREAVDAIYQNKYLLPSIQREVVWNEDQICRLFDSLMRGYPIGSLLFWKVLSENRQDFQFYEFMKNFHEMKQRHNPKANVDGLGDITAVLDGQQRLTSLYIGLRGTYATKIRWRRRDDLSAYPIRQLYLNIAAPVTEEDQQEYGLEYDFKFLEEDEANSDGSAARWFKVSEILNFEANGQYLIHDYLAEEGLGNDQFAGRCLFGLHQVIHNDGTIIYYEEKEPNLERVLDIFVRTNSAGTPLSHSDLLLSIATSQWQERDARTEIQEFVDEINGIGDGFGFIKDFVLKACLVLSDLDVAFVVKNFTKANMTGIENKWPEIASAIRTSIELASSFGFNRDTLLSNNALIPIAYYLYRQGYEPSFVTLNKFKSDRGYIRKWLTVSLLKRTFSGQSDTILRTIRTAILESDLDNGFPVENIDAKLSPQGRTSQFNKEELEDLLQEKYGSRIGHLVMTVLYPTLDFRNKFHQDHIHPRMLFTANRLTRRDIPVEDHEFFLGHGNLLPNLQFLEGPVNQEKQGKLFRNWVGDSYPEQSNRLDYMQRHFIPDVSLQFKNFEEFIGARRKLMLEKLMAELSVSDL